MLRAKDLLDLQIYFKKDGNEYATPFYWLDENEQIIEDKPLTVRNIYPELKTIFEVEENGTIQKSKTVRKVENTTNRTFGHGIKPKKFGQEQIDKIIKLRADGLSYRKIGEKVDCAASTVKEYLDKYNTNSI